MNMQKQWKSFRVTGFLYGIVLLTGLNFYFIHTAFDAIQYKTSLANLIYITSALSVLFALYSIYFVRLYIQKQMKKHSIHDHDTHLFNKKYFLAELHSTFNRSIRHENPLSLLFVTLDGFTDKTYDKKTKIKLLNDIGELFTSTTRSSDIACRYDVNHFAVLLPLTDKNHALLLENRLKETFRDHDFKVAPEITLSFVTTQADVNETEETFVSRTKAMIM